MLRDLFVDLVYNYLIKKNIQSSFKKNFYLPKNKQLLFLDGTTLIDKLAVI